MSITPAGRVRRWSRAIIPKAPYHISPGDLLYIRAAVTFPEAPIDRIYSVQPNGQVALGAAYGRVQLKGLSLAESETAIETLLKKLLEVESGVSVTLAGWQTRRDDRGTSKVPYRVAPGDLLDIRATVTFPEQPIRGTYLVEPSGQLTLGPAYGRVVLKGLSLAEAEAVVEIQLKQVFTFPSKISVTLAGWKMEEEAAGRVRRLEREVMELRKTVEELGRELKRR